MFQDGRAEKCIQYGDVVSVVAGLYRGVHLDALTVHEALDFLHIRHPTQRDSSVLTASCSEST